MQFDLTLLTVIAQFQGADFGWCSSQLDEDASSSAIAFLKSDRTDDLATVHLPLTSSAQRTAPHLHVKLDGSMISGGQGANCYTRADSGDDSSNTFHMTRQQGLI